MSDQQKLFLWLTMLAVLGLCLFPPWQGKEKTGVSFRYVSHRFIYTGPSASVLDNTRYRAFTEKTRFGKRIATGRLAIEVLSVAVVGGLIFVLLDFKRRRHRKNG